MLPRIYCWINFQPHLNSQSNATASPDRNRVINELTRAEIRMPKERKLRFASFTFYVISRYNKRVNDSKVIVGFSMSCVLYVFPISQRVRSWNVVRGFEKCEILYWTHTHTHALVDGGDKNKWKKCCSTRYFFLPGTRPLLFLCASSSQPLPFLPCVRFLDYRVSPVQRSEFSSISSDP